MDRAVLTMEAAHRAVDQGGRETNVVMVCGYIILYRLKLMANLDIRN